jgi:hypothetical protein
MIFAVSVANETIKLKETMNGFSDKQIVQKLMDNINKIGS